MPNNAYQRSVRREREIVNELRSLGYVAARSAGSKSKTDVWAFNPESRRMLLIQVKTEIGARGLKKKLKNTWKDVTVDEVWYYYQ